MRWKHLIAFEWFPTWKIEPDVQLIKDVLQDHLNTCGFNSDAITVDFFAAGTHNKLYTINTTYTQTRLPAQCIFRLALPVYPWYKVESEAATIEFVRHFTDTPVPLIYAYDSSTNNKLGLEWILMEKISGTPLEGAWPKLNSKNQIRLATSIAEWFHQLSSFAFDKIGSLYMRYTETDLEFYIGPMVDQYFYDGRRLAYRIDRGPFPSLHAYYDAVLDAQQQEFQDSHYLEEYHRLIQAAEYKNAMYAKQRQLKAKAEKSRDSAYKSDDGADDAPAEQSGPDDVTDIFDGGVLLFCEEDLVGVSEALEALRTHLSSLVQEPEGEKLSTMLMHHDLSSSNILVDKDGMVQALVDWEMISLDPPVRKDHYPQFLQSYDTEDAPTIQDLELYGEEDFLKDWKTYMLTRLRRAFRERLQELQSRYLLVFEEPSALHKELDERIILRWNHRSEVRDWVDKQLAPTDDDSAYDSACDSDEDRIDSVSGVLEGDIEDTDMGVEGDEIQVVEGFIGIETEKSIWGRVCSQCGRSPAPTWTEVVVSWLTDFVEYSG